MKKYILKSIFILTLGATALTSCTSDNDYETPMFRTPFYVQNFDELNLGDFQGEGYINKNLLMQDRKWKVATHGNQTLRYLSFTSYTNNSATPATNDNSWFILPGVNVSAQSNIVLNFDIIQGYPTNSFPLKVMYSTDFDGNEENISNATWTVLNINYNFNTNQGYSDAYTVKTINIPNTTSSNADVYVAFNYIGSNQGNGSTTTIQLDNIKLSK